jgi:hypothetical protein
MSKGWFRALVVGQALCVFAGLLPACTEDSPCDEGQTFRDGFCYTNPADAAAPADTSVPSDDGGGLAGEAAAASDFGKVCTVTAECALPTVYCAIQPGQPAGFCTTFGCDLDPSVCPTGWGCMDLTPFGLPQHMCIPGA